MGNLLRGFKDFIMRGNVVDMSVGIVIGAAFTSLVETFTASFIEPLIKVFSPGGASFAGEWIIADQHFTWAAAVNAVITFLITAAVLYFLVVAPMNRLFRRQAELSDPESVRLEELRLLAEIRDALVAGRQGTAGTAETTAPTQRQS